jgi:ATP-dependent exoDNAse (exonuclease V) alpha subunit
MRGRERRELAWRLPTKTAGDPVRVAEKKRRQLLLQSGSQFGIWVSTRLWMYAAAGSLTRLRYANVHSTSFFPCGLTAVIGSLPSVTAGEWLVANGWWVRDKEHGLRFKASTMKTVPPTTAEGIVRYFGSGLVKGIGHILAKKLVGRFGAEVLAVIENRSAELQFVDGIGPKRRERIAHGLRSAAAIFRALLLCCD